MAIPSALFIAALLMVVIGGPSAEALVIDGKTITAVNLESIIYCSRDGNKPTDGPVNGVAGIPVELRCGSASGDQVLRTSTTDLAGKYSFVFNLADALLFDPAKCYIAVKLPLGTCTVSLPNGLLRANISVLNLVQQTDGWLLDGLIGPCVLVPVA